MASKERIAVFPGSFDPFTNGHKAILDRALPLFDKIVIAIGVNTAKKGFFELEKRLAHIESVYKDFPEVTVSTYSCLTVDFCKSIGANFILRGLRNTSDFQFEKSIAQMNRDLVTSIETVFLVTPPEYGHISSTIVRELVRYNADVSKYIPGEIEK